MKKLLFWEQRIIYGIGNISLFAAFIICLVEVLRRYFFAKSFIWGNEAIIYLIMFPAFLVLGLAMKDNAHIRVMIFDRFFSSRNQKLIEMVTLSFEIVYIGIFCTLAWGMMLAYRGTGNISVGVKLPMYAAYGLLSIGFILLGLHSVERFYMLFKDFRRGGSNG